MRSLHELLVVYSNSSNVDNSNTNENNLAIVNHEQGEDGWQNKSGVDGSTTTQALPSSSITAVPSNSTEDEIWICTWTVWMRIATAATTTPVPEHSADPPLLTGNSNNSSTTAEERRRREYHQHSQQSLQHKQQFLTALLQIFPLIFNRIKTRFVKKKLVLISTTVYDDVIVSIFVVIPLPSSSDGDFGVVMFYYL